MIKLNLFAKILFRREPNNSKKVIFMLKLSERLLLTASFVRQGAVLADVGTDHAYIPAFLIKNAVISKAYACDINEGPLQNAAKTLESENIDGVSLILSDGLKNVSKSDISDVLIAGMGGELIARIISDCDWCEDKQLNFILQPMTKADYLRKFLYKNGYEIIKESIAAEGEKLYTVMLVRYSAVKQDISEAFALLGAPADDDMFKLKKEREIKRLKKVRDGLLMSSTNKEEIKQIELLISKLEVY